MGAVILHVPKHRDEDIQQEFKERVGRDLVCKGPNNLAIEPAELPGNADDATMPADSQASDGPNYGDVFDGGNVDLALQPGEGGAIGMDDV